MLLGPTQSGLGERDAFCLSWGPMWSLTQFCDYVLGFPGSKTGILTDFPAGSNGAYPLSCILGKLAAFGRVGKDGVGESERGILESKAFVRRKDGSESKYSLNLQRSTN